jgi:hypothetical protein
MISSSSQSMVRPEAYYVTDRDVSTMLHNMQLEGPLREPFAGSFKPILLSGTSIMLEEVGLLATKGLLPHGAIALDATLGISADAVGKGKWTLVKLPLLQALWNGEPKAIQGLSYDRHDTNGIGIDPFNPSDRSALQTDLRQQVRKKYQFRPGEYTHLLQQLTRIDVLSPAQAKQEHSQRLTNANGMLGNLLKGIVGDRVPDIKLPDHCVGGVIDYVGPCFSLDSAQTRDRYVQELIRITDPDGTILIATAPGFPVPTISTPGWGMSCGLMNLDHTQVLTIKRGL